MNFRKISFHEKICCLLVLLLFNLDSSSQGFSKQASFRKHFILICHFTMCKSMGRGGTGGGGGEPKKERKRVGLQQKNFPEKS